VENLFTRLPPMQPTSRNILMWNKGRKAIQKFGTFYRRRAEVFTAMYIMVVIIFAVYQIVSIFISTSIGITESMAFITIIALLVTIVILRMIFSGIKLNRQRKLMVAALKDYLVRIRLGSLEQIDTYVDRFNAKTNDNNNDDALTLVELKKKLKDDYKKIQKDAAEYHKAIKLVDGVMEAEEVTEKARILGITVDIQMLEFGYLAQLHIPFIKIYLEHKKNVIKNNTMKILSKYQPLIQQLMQLVKVLVCACYAGSSAFGRTCAKPLTRICYLLEYMLHRMFS